MSPIQQYQSNQRAWEAERAQLDAQLQTDALLARVCQPEPCCFVAPVEDELRATLGEILLIPAWFVLGMVGLAVCCLMWCAK